MRVMYQLALMLKGVRRMRVLSKKELKAVSGGEDFSQEVCIGTTVYTLADDNASSSAVNLAQVNVTATATNSAGTAGTLTFTSAQGNSYNITCPAGSLPTAISGQSNVSATGNLITKLLSKVGINVSGNITGVTCIPYNAGNGSGGTIHAPQVARGHAVAA
jgi:bacteriocin-like protein